MNRSLLIGIVLAVVAGSLIWIMMVPRSSPTVYEVDGRITGFSENGETVFIEHEEIPGYMPSMTMPFFLRDPAEIAGFETGDAVRFYFHVGDTTSWVSGFSLLSLAELQLPDSQDPRVLPVLGVEPLMAGDRVPAVSLVNQGGQRFELTGFDSKPVVLTFIYTRCPVPDLCPRMSLNFQKLQSKLAGSSQTEHVQLVSISFDPDYDTPGVLMEYGSRYTNDFSNWWFATGTADEISTAATLFGVTYRDESESVIEHNLSTAVIAPDGTVVTIWRGNDWSVDKVMETLALYEK